MNPIILYTYICSLKQVKKENMDMENSNQLIICSDSHFLTQWVLCFFGLILYGFSQVWVEMGFCHFLVNQNQRFQFNKVVLVNRNVWKEIIHKINNKMYVSIEPL